jgi:hypothetical protein
MRDGFKEWVDGWAEGWAVREEWVDRWAQSEDKGGVWVVFININDMYNNDVGKECGFMKLMK